MKSPALQRSTPGARLAGVTIDEAYLRHIVGELAFPRPVDSEANARARDMLVNEFGAFADPWVGGACDNIYVGDPKTATVLVGAHYDSVPQTPGADDNASAIAVLLAVAREIGGGSPCLFAAFNSEEYGLAGSSDFVDNLGEHRLEAVLILEMVGYRDRSPGSQRNPLPLLSDIPTTADFLGVVANSDALLERILTGAGACGVPFLGISIPDIADNIAAVAAYSPHLLRSDHTPFWQRGIPAAMLTDTAEFRNPNYHQPSDTPDTLDYAFMAEVAKAVIEMVRQA